YLGSGVAIQANSENSNGKYTGKYSFNVFAVEALIPYGIPVKASITIGGLRNDSKTLLRGQIFFQGQSPTNHTDVTDICLNYGPILIPDTQDGTNSLRHNMGNQSVEIREVRYQGDGRVVVMGLWTNRSDIPHTLVVSSANSSTILAPSRILNWCVSAMRPRTSTLMIAVPIP
ncbi:MAG: hypothetical protein HC821_01595, partial [Lewinella sp.]|nr:hypothetical protein [Lewinella sp.]